MIIKGQMDRTLKAIIKDEAEFLIAYLDKIMEFNEEGLGRIYIDKLEKNIIVTALSEYINGQGNEDKAEGK